MGTGSSRDVSILITGNTEILTTINSLAESIDRREVMENNCLNFPELVNKNIAKILQICNNVLNKEKTRGCH